MIDRNELEKNYNELQGEFEGYILMSDDKLKYIFTTKTILPKLEELYKNNNFIIEACLFDGNRSINIRQVNDKFSFLDLKLSDYQEQTQNEFISIEGKKVSIVTIWEEKEDECCENFKVLKPTMSVFAGFKGENDAK